MSKITKVKAHILKSTQLNGWEDRHRLFPSYRHLRANKQWREGWISFDTLLFCADDGNVYCGLNDMTGDLLYKFDPKSEKFTGLNTNSWTDSFDVKIHRTLLYNSLDKCFYFATSMLHDVEDQQEANGGKLVRYDPRIDKYEVLGIPANKLYVQSIAADFTRGKIYGFTYPAECVFEFDMVSRTSDILAWTGNACYMSQPHNPVVDSDGWLWGTYAETRAWDDMAGPVPIRLFKYHPDGKQFICFDHGLPRISDPEQIMPDPEKPDVEMEKDESRHKEDHGFVDSMCCDGKKFIYVGTTTGVLARIDMKDGRVEKLAHIIASGRMPALGIAEDGILYGAGGLKGETQIFKYDPNKQKIDSFYNLRDEKINDRPARIHELTVGPDNTIYLAENDNHNRSGYLWSVKLSG